ERDLGVALATLAARAGQPQVGGLALPRLEAGLKRWPQDVPALLGRGDVLSLRGELGGALSAYREALALAPQSDHALLSGARVAQHLRKHEEALGYARRAAAANPHHSDTRFQLAAALGDVGDWPAALAECRAALRLNPARLEVRRLLVLCLVRTGRRAPARA